MFTINNLNLLDNLNKTWEQARPDYAFVYDGIYESAVWEKEPIKIMFLLKESYSGFTHIANSGGYEVFGKAGSPHFFPNMAFTKYAINEVLLSKATCIPQYDKKKLPEVMNNDGVLDAVAHLNVKKTLGNSTSNGGDIMQYAKKDSSYLSQQIDLICPNVVVCDKVTINAYKKIYLNDSITQVGEWEHYHKDRLIVYHYHPSYFQMTGGKKSIFNELRDRLIRCYSDIEKCNFSWLS